MSFAEPRGPGVARARADWPEAVIARPVQALTPMRIMMPLDGVHGPGRLAGRRRNRFAPARAGAEPSMSFFKCRIEKAPPHPRAGRSRHGDARVGKLCFPGPLNLRHRPVETSGRVCRTQFTPITKCFRRPGAAACHPRGDGFRPDCSGPRGWLPGHETSDADRRREGRRWCAAGRIRATR